MIKIPIDSNNIILRDIHLSKVKKQIKLQLRLKRMQFPLPLGNPKFEVFNWLYHNIEEILIGTNQELIIKINLYNNLLKSFPLINNYSYKKLTMEELKKVSNDNALRKTFPNKKEFLKYLLVNRNAITNLDEIKLIQYRDLLSKDLNEVFINLYENWDDIFTDYTRYDFTTKHELATCPYCNRNYIFIVNKKKGKLRPEIDHFYPKSIYPFLAMSFYNLIPCCQTCNRTKKDRDAFNERLVSPYDIDYNKYKFNYLPQNVSFYQVKKRKFGNYNFDIELKGNLDKNDSYFKLTDLYRQHKDIVEELLIKKTTYPKSYIKQLQNDFSFSKDEVYRYLICNYLKNIDLKKRPLSKFTRDISEELGLI